MIIGENPKKVRNIESLTGNHVILKLNFQLCNIMDLWKDSHLLSIPRHIEFLKRAIVQWLPISLHLFLLFNFSLCLLLSLSFSLLSLISSSGLSTCTTLRYPPYTTIHYTTLHYTTLLTLLYPPNRLSI
jgi:pilus assembly protein TadC